MSSGTYDPDLRGWKFDDLIAKVSTAAIVSNTARNFFFAVRMSTVAVTPRSFALMMDNPDFVVLSSTLVGVAYNSFPIITATSPVRNQPATIRIQAVDIGAWWQAGVDVGTYSYVEQGTDRAGFLAIKAWTDNFVGTIKSFRIIKTGTGSGADLKSMRLFLDDGDGVFGKAIDKEVTDPANPPAFNIADPGTFALPLYNPGVDGTVSIATRTYFVVYEFKPDAIPSPLPLDPATMVTHGARLENSAVSLMDGVVGGFDPVASSTVPLYSTSDMVYLNDVNKSQPNDFAKPSLVTQNDKNKAVAALDGDTRDCSAVWRGPADRWVTGAENQHTRLEQGHRREKNKPLARFHRRRPAGDHHHGEGYRGRPARLPGPDFPLRHPQDAAGVHRHGRPRDRYTEVLPVRQPLPARAGPADNQRRPGGPGAEGSRLL